jgi:hypothetical protein
MVTNESPRISGLKNAIEHCRQSGLSENEVLEIARHEVFGASRLRAAIKECMAPDRLEPVSFYEQTLDKKISNEEILAAVHTASQGEKP